MNKVVFFQQVEPSVATSRKILSEWKLLLMMLQNSLIHFFGDIQWYRFNILVVWIEFVEGIGFFFLREEGHPHMLLHIRSFFPQKFLQVFSQAPAAVLQSKLGCKILFHYRENFYEVYSIRVCLTKSQKGQTYADVATAADLSKL